MEEAARNLLTDAAPSAAASDTKGFLGVVKNEDGKSVGLVTEAGLHSVEGKIWGLYYKDRDAVCVARLCVLVCMCVCLCACLWLYP